MNVRVGLWRKLSAKELMLLNCDVGEDSWESLGLQKMQPVHSKGAQSWVFFGRIDAEAETPVLWPPPVKGWLIGKRPWSWEGLGAEGEGDDRGWDGWMASPTQWTWVWVSSGSWWWTGKPGVLRFMGSQRVRHDWATELNWIYMFQCCSLFVPPLSPPCLQVCSLCLHLRCCPLAVAGGSYSLWCRLLTAVASLVAQHGLCCLTACGIVPDQESNHVPCADRWILNHWTRTTREVQGNCPYLVRPSPVSPGHGPGARNQWSLETSRRFQLL